MSIDGFTTADMRRTAAAMLITIGRAKRSDGYAPSRVHNTSPQRRWRRQGYGNDSRYASSRNASVWREDVCASGAGSIIDREGRGSDDRAACLGRRDAQHVRAVLMSLIRIETHFGKDVDANLLERRDRERLLRDRQ